MFEGRCPREPVGEEFMTHWMVRKHSLGLWEELHHEDLHLLSLVRWLQVCSQSPEGQRGPGSEQRPRAPESLPLLRDVIANWTRFRSHEFLRGQEHTLRHHGKGMRKEEALRLRKHSASLIF